MIIRIYGSTPPYEPLLWEGQNNIPAPVIETGIARTFAVWSSHEEYLLHGSVGDLYSPGDLNLNTRALMAGQILTVDMMFS